MSALATTNAKMLNLTPHPLRVQPVNAAIILPAPVVPAVLETEPQRKIGVVTDGSAVCVDVVTPQRFKGVTGLPADCSAYSVVIVGTFVAQWLVVRPELLERHRIRCLLSPDTGPESALRTNGSVSGVRRLQQHWPVVD